MSKDKIHDLLFLQRKPTTADDYKQITVRLTKRQHEDLLNASRLLSSTRPFKVTPVLLMRCMVQAYLNDGNEIPRLVEAPVEEFILEQIQDVINPKVTDSSLLGPDSEDEKLIADLISPVIKGDIWQP